MKEKKIVKWNADEFEQSFLVSLFFAIAENTSSYCHFCFYRKVGRKPKPIKNLLLISKWEFILLFYACKVYVLAIDMGMLCLFIQIFSFFFDDLMFCGGAYRQNIELDWKSEISKLVFRIKNVEIFIHYWITSPTWWLLGLCDPLFEPFGQPAY